MKIAVNTRLLIKNKLDGIGWFSFETLKRITQNHPEHEFIFIFDRKYDEEFIFSNNIKPVIASPQARHPILWYLYFEHSIPKILKKYKADLFLSPDGWTSLKTNVKTLSVIHDINFEYNPEYLPFSHRIYCKSFFPRFADKSTRIATVSEFSKNNIAELYNIDKNKIDVVYNGVNDKYKPLGEQENILTRQVYSKGLPYFLFLSSIHPRKNLSNLLKAYDIFMKKTSAKMNLLICGSRFWWTKEMDTTLKNMQYKDNVIFIGRLEEEELKKVLSAAFAMTYVSFFEGFGIPILEAFSSEIPVITSCTTSMPEVGKDAVLYTNPESHNSIADEMIRLYKDNDLRNMLILKGRKQKEEFSWDITADKLWESIEKTMKKDI